MPEWAPGRLEGLLSELTAAGRANFRAGGLQIAAAIEAKTKANLSLSSHRSGTPTPAARGGPPALMTGALRRSIGHEYLPGVDPNIKVGTVAGVYPPSETSHTSKGTRSRRTAGSTATGGTPTSKYGLYLETVWNYPFLKPAFDAVVKDQVAAWLKAFAVWPRA